MTESNSDRLERYKSLSEMRESALLGPIIDEYVDCILDGLGALTTWDELIVGWKEHKRAWVHSFVTFGDLFLFFDVSPGLGITFMSAVPPDEMKREEGYDPDDPNAVRYRWVNEGNTLLPNSQIAHFRRLGNDKFLPYGCSAISNKVGIWQMLREGKVPEGDLEYVEKKLVAYLLPEASSFENSTSPSEIRFSRTIKVWRDILTDNLLKIERIHKEALLNVAV